ncbi:putative LOB domain-containing protein [Melia azedarach]|uniref:LOB domain-containing protein n=1 Tax=Melia azedarach TaxID=155640 RepID=A0ACC1XLT5_MELAZ|nr:putative LOB domain-containing protein [Melia azedarach]
MKLSLVFFFYLTILLILPFWFQYLNARSMTLKGGTSQACAACKYQRRRCSAECPLAPYFPPDQPKMFQNAHKLFGVSNILKILKILDSEQKPEAMRSIIYQANIRDKYPVHGCWGIICQLRYQIWQAEEELHAVHAQLDVFRQHYQQQISSMTDDVPSQLELGMAPPNALSLFNHNPQPYNAVPAFTSLTTSLLL